MPTTDRRTVGEVAPPPQAQETVLASSRAARASTMLLMPALALASYPSLEYETNAAPAWGSPSAKPVLLRPHSDGDMPHSNPDMRVNDGSAATRAYSDGVPPIARSRSASRSVRVISGVWEHFSAWAATAEHAIVSPERPQTGRASLEPSHRDAILASTPELAAAASDDGSTSARSSKYGAHDVVTRTVSGNKQKGATTRLAIKRGSVAGQDIVSPHQALTARRTTLTVVAPMDTSAAAVQVYNYEGEEAS